MQIFLIMALSDCVFGDGAPLPGERPSLACPKTVYSFCNAGGLHLQCAQQLYTAKSFDFQGFRDAIVPLVRFKITTGVRQKNEKKVRKFKDFGAFLLDYALQML